MDRQLPRRGQGGDAQRFGDAATLGEVRLQNRDRAVLDHPVELEARVVVLAGGERRAAEAARLAIAAVVVSWEGLFEPANAELVHRWHHAARVIHLVANVRVSEEHQIIAERLAHGAHALDVFRGRIADAQLDRLVARIGALARFVDQLRRWLVAERDAARIGRNRFARAAQ